MFADLLRAEGSQVTIVDIAPGPGVMAADVTAPGPELRGALGTADAVVLAVPERVALACLGPVSGALRPGALLVDTLSVKGPFASAVAELGADIEAVGLNPMFAPSLGMAGRPVAEVVLRDGQRVRTLRRVLAEAGALLTAVDASAHDQLAAAAQAMTHASVLAFGHALAGLDLDVRQLSALAPPPHTTMLALLTRICTGEPDVYWDVQSTNPMAASAREALAHGLRAVADMVEAPDPAAFSALLARLAGYLGPELERYREHCARLFAVVPQQPHREEHA